MNGVMPVVVVIGSTSIPAPVMWLQCIVCPTLTSICAADCDSLTSEPQRPDIWRMRVGDVRLDRLGVLRSQRAANQPGRLSHRILNARVAFDSRHVLPTSQRFS